MGHRAHGRLGWALLIMAALVVGTAGWLGAATRAKTKPTAKKPAVKKPAAKKPPAKAPKTAPAQPAIAAGGVEIISPESNAKVRGVTTVRVTWSNTKGYVLFRVDDKFLFASTAPYKMLWDTSALADGEHVLSVDAFDSEGQFEGSSSIQAVVQNTIPTPDSGVLLSVRFGSEDMLNRAVNARGEMAALSAGEALPAGYDVLSGSFKGSITQTVMDPFYQGASVLLRNRLKDGWVTIGNTRTSLPEVGQYAMVQVSRNGLAVPSVTAVRRTRLAIGEVSLALADYPVFPGDSWQSPIGAVVDLYSRRTVYVQAQHTFEGLRWFNERECAMVTSTYSIPALTLYQSAPAQASLSGTAGYSLQLTQMGAGRGAGRGGGGGGRRGGGGGGGAVGGAGGARRGGGGGAGGGAGGARAGANQQGARGGAQAQTNLLSARLVNLEGVRVTYLSRRSGSVIRTEDTVKGRVEFKTAGTYSSARALGSDYSVDLTQMGPGMRGGGRRGGGGGGGGAVGGGGGGARRAGGGGGARAGGGTRAGGGQGGRQAGQAAGTTAGQRAAAGRIPASVEYGFRLTTELVPK
jgi:hypothetical protein